MARKKDSQALFEVISRNKDKHVLPKFGIPDWMKGRKAKSADEESAEPAVEPKGPRETATVEPAPKPPAATPKPAPAPPLPPRPVVKPLPKPTAKPTAKLTAQADEPVFRFDGEQIRLRLSILTAGVSAMGLIIVLLGAFWLGRTTAPRGPSGPTEKAQVGPTTPKGGGNGGGHNGGRHVVNPTKPPKLVVGKYYLVIQSLLGGRTPAKLAEANKIAKFCNDNGVPAKVMQGSTTYYVWALRPFEYAETMNEVGDRFAAEIEALGRKYKAAGGKYQFTQRDRVTGKLEGWFMKHQGP